MVVVSFSVEEFNGLVQDRIASEFSRLQYLMSLSNQHPIIASLEPVSSSHGLQWLPWLHCIAYSFNRTSNRVQTRKDIP